MQAVGNITGVLSQLLTIREDLALLELADKVLEVLLGAVVLLAGEILRVAASKRDKNECSAQRSAVLHTSMVQPIGCDDAVLVPARCA